MSSPEVNAAVEILRRAKKLTVFTGAGISAESGIPTFRDAGGIRERFPPERFATWAGLVRTALARPRELAAFAEEVLGAIGNAEPNSGHRAIAELERHRSTRVITQNVDGLHQLAGSTIVREIHGSMLEVTNVSGALRALSHADLRAVSRAVAEASGRPLVLPAVLRALRPILGVSTAGLLRPNVVLFGSSLKEPDWMEAQMDAGSSDVMLVVGTSGTVMPAATLPMKVAARRGVVIAVDPNPVLVATLQIFGPAGELLPHLIQEAFGA